MPKHSVRKGAEYERRISVALSLWITDGMSDDAVWRSAMSGGRTTLKNRTFKKTHTMSSQAGDFDANSPEGLEFVSAFYADGKRYADLHVFAWVYQKDGMCKKTLDPVWQEAREYGRIPLAILKEDYRDDLVLTDQTGFDVFSEAYIRKRGQPIPYLAKFFRAMTTVDMEPVYVLRYAHLVAALKWADVRQVLIDRDLLRPIANTLMARPVTGSV